MYTRDISGADEKGSRQGKADSLFAAKETFDLNSTSLQLFCEITTTLLSRLCSQRLFVPACAHILLVMASWTHGVTVLGPAAGT